MGALSDAERSALGKLAAAARWDGADLHHVVRKMLDTIDGGGGPQCLYKRGERAWFSPPDHYEAERWTLDCVGTYGPGATFTQVIEDAAEI